MALFAMANGTLSPATPVDFYDAARVMSVVRTHILDIVGIPLLPVHWSRSSGESSLLAVDASGSAVTVAIKHHLTALSLFESVNASGRYSHTPLSEIAQLYPGGSRVFDYAWEEFLASAGSNPPQSPRLVIVMFAADDDVYPVLANLSDGVRVLTASVYAGDLLEVSTLTRRMLDAASESASRPANAADSPVAAEPVTSTHAIPEVPAPVTSADAIPAVTGPVTSTYTVVTAEPESGTNAHSFVAVPGPVTSTHLPVAVPDPVTSANPPTAASDPLTSARPLVTASGPVTGTHAAVETPEPSTSLHTADALPDSHTGTHAVVAAPEPSTQEEAPAGEAAPSRRRSRRHELQGRRSARRALTEAGQQPEEAPRGRRRARSAEQEPPRVDHHAAQDVRPVEAPAPAPTSARPVTETPAPPELARPVTEMPAPSAPVNAAPVSQTTPRVRSEAPVEPPDETPTYRSVREAVELSRKRTEQLLWERSAPRKPSMSDDVLISESAAADQSSFAVIRAAERERLSPAGRLQAIAGRNRTPILLRAAAGQASGKLTAWGVLIVDGVSYTDPTEAARAVLGRHDVDGWVEWTTLDGRPLGSL